MTIRPLTLREKVFVAQYEALGGGKGAGKPAAIAAGYSENSAHVMACRLLQREPVQREIQKREKARLRSLFPKALDVLEEILDSPEHKDRLKAVGQVLNRVDPAVATTAHLSDINVTVRQQTTDELGVKALRLMREIGATREMMERVLGCNGLPLLERMLDGVRAESKSAPVTIEGEVLEAESDDLDDE
jgi:phage terminase small subunit